MKYLVFCILIFSLFVIVVYAYARPEKCEVGNDKYDRHIMRAVEKHWGKEYKADWCWYKKQLIAESSLRPNVCSASGACGIAQFMPRTAKAFKIDPLDPYESIDAGAHLMGKLLTAFDSGGKMCSFRMSWASYQWGYGRVKKAVRKSGEYCWRGGIDRYAPTSTRAYITNIENM